MSSNPSLTSSGSPSASDLAIMAARAAVALELARNARETQWTDVRELGTVLRSLLAEGSPLPQGPTRQALVQTEVADVVDRALAMRSDGRPTTLDELSGEVGRLAAALLGASAETEPAELERLRDLCLALARVAQARHPAPVYDPPGAGAAR